MADRVSKVLGGCCWCILPSWCEGSDNKQVGVRGFIFLFESLVALAT